MKKINLITALTLLASQQLFAQDTKIKSEQPETGVWAEKVKVDGKLTEWNDNFQAYNKATKLFYTVSNDDKSLYLVVKSTDMQTSNKIAAGGITLAINTEGKKKDKDVYSVSFPVAAATANGGFGGMGGFGGAPGGGGAPGAIAVVGGFGGGGFGGGPGGPGGMRNFTPDSATLAANRKKTLDAAKEIKVFGFKDVTDSLISIYNEYGIKAGIGYDAQGNYTYELAVPLKLLNLTADGKAIAYNIKVNGMVMPDFVRRMEGGGAGGPGGGFAAGGGAPGGGGGPGGAFGGGGAGGPGGGAGGPGGGFAGGGRGPGGGGGMAEMFAATDFWGKYILAKK
jgi:hypothetical protein